MNMNIDEIRGPLAGFMAAAMIFASAGTAVAAQDNTMQASVARTVIQTEINASGAGSSSTSDNEVQNSEDNDNDAGSSEF